MSARETIIRPLQPDDEAAWRRLWTGYLDFYDSAVSEAVYVQTWSRLLPDAPEEIRGRLACAPDGTPVGLAHFFRHRHCWRLNDVCYLQDLFVEPAQRGGGAGRALMAAVFAVADADGLDGVYWLTQDFNAPARKLYDQVGAVTPFIKYNRA